MKLIYSFVLCSLALLLFTAPIAAQEAPRWVIAGGASLPDGDEFRGDYATGFNLFAGVTLGDRDGPLTFRIDGLLNRFTGQPLVMRPDLSYPDFSIYALTANALYTFPGRVVQPYLITGVGYYNENGGTALHNLGLNAGAGLRFPQLPLQPFIEGRLHNIATIDLSNYDRGGRTRFSVFSAGVSF